MSLTSDDHTHCAYVRLQWLDFTNTLRMSILPKSYFDKLVTSSKDTPTNALTSRSPGVGVGPATLGLVFLALAPGFTANGEYLVVPDTSSYRLCHHYAHRHAVAMGYLREKNPSPGKGLDVPICPRTLLKRILDNAARIAHVSFLVGFETEFILLSETSPEPVAVNDADWATSRKFPTGQVETIALEEMSDCLIAAGIEVQLIHAESAPGQYEIVTGPLPPMEACDALVFTRETIYNIARKHKLRATLAPRLFSNSAGSAAHAHLSVHPTQPFPDVPARVKKQEHTLAPTLSLLSQSFLESLLAHLPSLMTFTLPTKFSYARMLDGIWSGGTWVGWGVEQREVPIRVTGTNAPDSYTNKKGESERWGGGGQHFEIRCLDGTANPYIAIASILAVGTDGILKLVPLSTPSPPDNKSIAQMTDEEREACFPPGTSKGRLPLNLEEARAKTNEDPVIKELLGKEFVEKYLSVNETFERLFVAETEKELVTKLVEYF